MTSYSASIDSGSCLNEAGAGSVETSILKIFVPLFSVALALMMAEAVEKAAFTPYGTSEDDRQPYLAKRIFSAFC